MKMFWPCFAVDGVIFAGLFYFFLLGLGDGTVSSFNIAIWLPLIGVPAAVLAGGLWLKGTGRPGPATGLVALMAVPGLLLGCFGLILIMGFSSGHH